MKDKRVCKECENGCSGTITAAGYSNCLCSCHIKQRNMKKIKVTDGYFKSANMQCSREDTEHAVLIVVRKLNELIETLNKIKVGE